MIKMEKNNNIIGNSTTILNTIIIAIAGLIFGRYGATLLQLGIDQTILTEIITFTVFTIFAYINAKYHNTLFNNTPNTIQTEQQILNDEYITNEDENDGI